MRGIWEAAAAACVVAVAWAHGADCPLAEPSVPGQVWRFDVENLPRLGHVTERLRSSAIVTRIGTARFHFDPGPVADTTEYEAFLVVREGLQRLPGLILDALPPTTIVAVHENHSCTRACKARDGQGALMVVVRPSWLLNVVDANGDYFVPALLLHELAHVLDDYRGSTSRTSSNMHVSDRPSWVRARDLDCGLAVTTHAAMTQYEDFAETMGWWWAVRVLGADDGGHARTTIRYRMAWFDREVRRAAMLGVPLFAVPETPARARDQFSGNASASAIPYPDYE